MTSQLNADVDPLYRQSPRNIEAEQALLGAILVNNEAYHRVAGVLEAQHFFDDLHRAIYEVAAKLISAGEWADPITLKPLFANIEPIDLATTVPRYLGRLAANAATIINAREYARTIRDLATRRQLILISEDMAKAAYDSPVDFPPTEQIEEVEARLYSLAESSRFGQGFLSFERTSAQALEMVANARKSGGVSGLPTSFTDIDAKLGGLQASDLVILAGRPSMGKTALATNIVFSLATAGSIVAYFSLEMSAEQLTLRILSKQAGIPLEKIRRGMISDEQFRLLAQKQKELRTIPLHIDQMGAISISQLSGRVRWFKRQHKGLDLIVVDYLQLMTGTAKRDNSRVQEVTEITTGLKALAKELNAPVLALSQLSGAVENREDKRPQLATCARAARSNRTPMS